MADDAFTTWLERGRAHQRDGRPADAIPVFRRAAREAPGSPVAHFHLGEVWWQLGRPMEALQAWHTAARLDATFLPARLALAEAALMHGELAVARDAAAEALAIAAGDARVRVTQMIAGAATGDAAALRALPALLAAEPALAREPPLGKALAVALEATPGPDSQELVRALAIDMATLPLALVAALAARGVEVPQTVGTRAFTLDDRDALRRLAVMLHGHAPVLAAQLGEAYCALSATLPHPPVPFLWPQRTRGVALRLAWVMPAPASAAWPRARDALQSVAAAFAADAMSAVLVCCGDPDATRAQLGAAAPVRVVYAGLALPADSDSAKAIAARDCDVMVDATGLDADIVGMLLARPARALVGLDVGVPAHLPPIVERTFANAPQLAAALRELNAATTRADARMTADDLAAAWDAAVTLHREGDLPAASDAYAALLQEQPGFAPALHLAGVAAASHSEPERAEAAFAAALAAQPAFIDARMAAADLALVMRRYDDAMRLVDDGLRIAPFDPALLRMQGRVHARRGDSAAALAIYDDILLRAPTDALAHFDHGTTLQRAGDVTGAARAYQRALTFKPDLIAADFNLGVLFEQQGNRPAAAAAFRHVLAVDPRHTAAYKHLGDVLLAAGEIDAWLANFTTFERHCPNALPLAVYALEACQHAADFARLDRYLDGLRRDAYHASDEEDLADCLESLLYLLLFFDVEQTVMLRLAQAYDAVARRVYGVPMQRNAQRAPGRLRIGYVSGDLRNHVMGKMLWAAVAHHDRAQFDIFFYSTSRERDEWTERFAGMATRFVSIVDRDDFTAANMIGADDLDLLVDLSTHTQGSRPGVVARKPARVALTHVASAGTLGMTQVDYKLTDHFADVPESQEFQFERLLAMEGCVYPYRHIAADPDIAFDRATLGIAQDAFVIGAFVNPLKLSRRCLRLWRDVLARIPRACVAFSPANPALRASYERLAEAGGIGRERIVFLPQGRDDAQNQARYRVIDVVLDTMPFGGVNGTLEALDANVPVVTLVGKRHGERTTYSILANLGVRDTVAQTGRDYVDIVARLAADDAFMRKVRAAIARGIAQSPLTDMVAHTRHLEAAYRIAIDGNATRAR